MSQNLTRCGSWGSVRRVKGLLDQQGDGRNDTSRGNYREYVTETELSTRELGDEKRTCDAAESSDAKHPGDAGGTSLRGIESSRQRGHG